MASIDVEAISHEELKEEFRALSTELTTVKDNEAKLGEAQNKLEVEAKTLHSRVKELEKAPGGGTTAKDRVVYVSHDRKIEKLRGRPKPGSRDPEIDEWIGDVAGVIKSRKVENADAVQYIKDHLGGDARTEIVSRNPATVKAPEDVFKILREVFEFGETLPQLRRKFYSRIQQEGESILQFSHVLSRLHRRMEQMDSKLEKERDEAMKSQLVDGVRDPELQKEALRWTREREGSFFELREWTSEWTRQGQGAPTGQGSTKTKSRVSTNETSIDSLNSNQPLLEAIKKQGDMLQTHLKAQQAELTQALKELKLAQVPAQGVNERSGCFLCGSPDHWQYDCPQNDPKGISNRGNNNVNQGQNSRGRGRGRRRRGSRHYHNAGQKPLQEPQTDQNNAQSSLN
jgi:hypothetical protein